MDSTFDPVVDNEPMLLMHYFIFNVAGRINRKIKLSAISFFLWLTFCQIVSVFNMPKFEFTRVLAASVYFYFSISLISLTFLMDIENLAKSNRSCWQLSKVALAYKEEIAKFTRILEALWLIAIIIIILFFLPNFLNPHFLRSNDYSIILMGKYFPYLEPIYLICVALFLILSFPVSFSWCLHLLYFSWHVQFQVINLTKFIRDLGKNFAEDFGVTHCGVALDGYYQRCMWRDLTFIILKHTELLSYNRKIMTHVRFDLNSLLLGICGICLFFVGLGMAVIAHIRESSLMLIYLIFLEIFSFSSQAHESKFLSIHDLALKAPWYKWDIKNRKAYLLFVQQSAQVVTYQSFNIRLNRQFQWQVLKVLYSGLIIFANLHI